MDKTNNTQDRYTLTEFLYTTEIPQMKHRAATEHVLAAAEADGFSTVGLADDSLAYPLKFWFDLVPEYKP